VSRVGPFNPGDKITKEQAEQMDAYMLRVWVEIGLYLHVFSLWISAILRGDSPFRFLKTWRYSPISTRWLSHVLVQSMLCEESI
jgi:hypothetical protein